MENGDAMTNQSHTFAAEWDTCWNYEENQPWYPDEQIVRFLARYVCRRTGIAKDTIRYYSDTVPSGLDLGCGKGRHVVLMKELGIEAYGLDVSERAVEFASAWLKSKGLSANIAKGSITHLQYPDQKFNFVLSHGVFDHVLAAVRHAAVNEVERVLQPNGLFFVSVISNRDSAFGMGRQIEDKTWIVEDGFESNIPQAFFDPPRILHEFSQFQVESIVLCECEAIEGRSLIGTDKHYQRDSRYYLTLRKKS